MSQTERHRRLRLLLRQHNRQRKQQAKKIDILCNDLIAAQRHFIQKLSHVGFAANFYKALLGSSDLRTLLAQAGQLIQQDVPGAAVAFFLRQTDGCELHVAKGQGADGQRLEECFTDDLIESVCKANRPCVLDDLLGMGLAAHPTLLRSVSMVTLPLNDLGRSLGFVLLSRATAHPLSADEVERVSLITCGLSRAIRGCSLTLHMRD